MTTDQACHLIELLARFMKHAIAGGSREYQEYLETLIRQYVELALET